jgi:hypothetical protein
MGRSLLTRDMRTASPPTRRSRPSRRSRSAQELADIYPEFEAKIIDLLLRIEQVDKEAVHANYTKPLDSKDERRATSQADEKIFRLQ